MPRVDVATQTPDLPVDRLSDSVIEPPDLAPPSCSSLRPLVERGPLTRRHARQVLFAPDGRSLLLQVIGSDAGSTDEALLVSLPGGEQRTLATDILAVEWLGAGAVLVMTADSGLRAVSLGGDTLLTVAGPTCDHVAVPDGSRIYYLHDCDRRSGVLSVVDVAAGTTRRLAEGVLKEGLVVSPGSRWAAYVVRASATDASDSTTAVHVVEVGEKPHAVPVGEPTLSPAFLSDDIVLVESMPTDYLSSKIWRHRLGTGETKLLAEGDHGYNAYELNADRSVFLLTKFPSSTSPSPAELYFVSVADGSLLWLASDLMDTRMFEMRVRAFAIAPPSQRVIYIAETTSDGRRSYGVVSVSQSGGGRVQLAANAGRVAISPYGDRAAIITTGDASRTYRTTVVSPTTGAAQFSSEDVAGVQTLGFVPGDRGFLFVDKETDAKIWRMRHFSFPSGEVTRLAEWGTNKLVPYNDPTGIESSSYLIDPSGCFVPVDSDLDPQGTRLILVPQ